VPPVLGLAGSYTPLLVGNALLVERVFEIPGVYKLVPAAMDTGNYEVIQGLVVVSALLVVLVTTLFDVALGLPDPRIRRPAPSMR
jgi:ABC-type dipeptide/oligopeptide/nickel transport system permease component